MLTPPLNFSNDIQGRDTNLVPVVLLAIGDIRLNISTNSFQFGTKNIKPLLRNIPSLKESIDISTRKYKISNITLDISNFPYEGQRFSDLVGDNSVINSELELWWMSSSGGYKGESGGATPDQLTANEINAKWFKVFFGTIRRYDMTDEKIRLVVEDRSQATLHKDLPLPDNYLTGANVPDKYKNKPIPMVYGHVDRSPCVIKRSPLSTEWGLDYGDIDIFPDSLAPTSINGQYVYFGDKYLSIPEILSDPNYSNLFELSEESINIIDTSIIDFIRLQSINSNPISRNLIPTKESRSFDDMVVLPLREKTTDLDEYIFADSTNYTSVYKSDTKEVMGSFVRDHYGGGDLAFWLGDSRLQEMEGTSSDIFYDMVVNDSSEDVALPACLLETGVANGSFEETIGIIDFDIDTYYGNVLDAAGSHNIRLSIMGGSKIEILNQINHSFHDSSAGWHLTTLDGTGFISIKSKDGGAVDRLKVAFWAYIDGGGVICAGKLKFNTFNLNRYGLIEDVNNQDFYANVNGRAMISIGNFDFSPAAPQAIAHILENELGQGTITLPDASVISVGSLYDWSYAFTVDSKISSKKLIENIASASPYIPRFDPISGNFKFNVIPRDGGITDHTIKEADVIDFSFSRTKIEDVYTKIQFFYNWDYARGEFNDSVEVDTDELISGYDPEYYGFKMPSGGSDYDHAESTLVIDDDRGKYIRKYDYTNTAQDFAEWYLLWSCNQHLKMKIKLPLKYMNLEIGDFVDFDAILGGVKPYGINYIGAGEINYQQVFKNFLIVSTNKTLKFCEISCIQMHNLGLFQYIDTTFSADIFYDVITSPELNGVLIEDIHEEFPELENLIGIEGYSVQTMYNESSGVWTGNLTSLGGGLKYQIKFSQETTTNLFQLSEFFTDG